LLSGRGTADILASLRETFDIVLVDSPPVVPVTDAAVLSPKVDATFLVITVGTTTTKQATRAIELLRQVSAPLVGLILNGVPPGGGGYGYDYTYGYTPLDAATASRKARLPTNGNGAMRERPILTPKAARPPESSSDGGNGP
jgi:Mrp family chromosome partitioning ATPase